MIEASGDSLLLECAIRTHAHSSHIVVITVSLNGSGAFGDCLWGVNGIRTSAHCCNVFVLGFSWIGLLVVSDSFWKEILKQA